MKTLEKYISITVTIINISEAYYTALCKEAMQLLVSTFVFHGKIKR